MLSRYTASRRTRATSARVRVTPLVVAIPCLFSCIGVLGTARNAHAQTSSSSIQFDVPAGPLGEALNRFAQQANVAIAVDESKVHGLRTQGLSGHYGVEEGFDALLRDSGYAIGKAAGGYVLVPATKEQPSEGPSLPAVTVSAKANSPAESVSGYVAKRSAAGTKTDTALIETPQSISVVTREQMDDQQPQEVSQALRYVPGLYSEPMGIAQVQDGATGMMLRGFTADQYLDGLTGNVLGRTIVDPYLLERVEVVGGPSGALYGQGKPGGLIDMSSKLPLATSFNEVQIGFGNRGRYEGTFDFSGPVDQSGQLLYRLTGIAYSENTQTDFVTQKRVAIAPAITWRPDANTSFTLLGKYINDPDTGAYAAVPAKGSVLPNPNGKIPTSFFPGDPNYMVTPQKLWSVGYIFDHSFNDVWSVRQNFRFERNETTNAYVTTSGFLTAGTQTGNLNAQDLRTLTRAYSTNAYTSDSLLLDNQARAKFTTGAISHDVLVGLDYQRYVFDKNGLTGRAGSFPSIDIYAPVYYQTLPAQALKTATPLILDETQSQLGVYAQDQIKYGQWRFLLGGREDWAQTPTRSSAVTPPLQSDHKFTWHTGLVYLFDSGLAPYVSYSTSFSPSVGTGFSGESFLPTTAQQYEAGFKYQPKGSDSFITAAIYNLTQQNVLTTDPEHPTYSIQTGEARSRGVELQAHASLTESLRLIATLTYNRSINTETNTTSTGIDGVAVSTQGKYLVEAPVWMASLLADYTVHSGALNGLGLSGGLRYIGSSYGDAANSFKVPAYTLFDASVRYDLGRANRFLRGVTAQLNVSNLFDKTYVATCTSSTACYFGIRRTIYGTLKYVW